MGLAHGDLVIVELALQLLFFARWSRRPVVNDVSPPSKKASRHLPIVVWLTWCWRLASATEISPRNTLNTIRVFSSGLHLGCLLAMRDRVLP